MNKVLLKMAFLNLARNRGRTLITLVSIGIGSMSAMLFHGYAEETYRSLAESFAHKEGHLQVGSAAFFAASRPELGRVEKSVFMSVSQLVASDPALASQITAMTTRRKVSGLVSTGEKTSVFSGYGVEGPAFAKLASGSLPIQRGRTLDGSHTGVVLGPLLAERIGAEPGDWISLFVTTERGKPDAMDVEVLGIKAAEGKDRDAHTLFMSESAAMALKGSTETDVLMIGLEDTAATEAGRKLVEAKVQSLGLADLTVKAWSEVAEYYQSVKNLYDRIFLYIEGLLLLITVVTVANAVAMAVIERGGEIAMLRAMGASAAQVRTVFLLEGVLVGVAGSFLGVLLAVVVALFTDLTGGISMPPPPNGSEGYQLFFHLTVNGGFLIMLLTLVSTVVASVFPAARASRQNIAKGLSGLLMLALAIAVTLPAGEAAAKGGLTPEALLRAIDAHRDVPANGFVTDVKFTSYLDKKQDEVMHFRVAGQDGTTLAFSISDPAGKRMAILAEGKGMWMQKEGMRKAFRVSPAQRLMGGASNADVITVHYATDYVPTEMKVNGKKYLLVLSPKPGNESAAYGKIRVITTADGQVTAGEFYAVSGKLLKTSTFAYAKNGTLKSALIRDAVRTSETTRVDYGAISAMTLSAAFFNVQNMLPSAQKLIP